MFDLGMMELLVIGVVALIVVGPKDLPVMFRTVGQFMGRMRGMARDFQRAMNDAADETGMRDLDRDIRRMTSARKLGLGDVKDAARSMADWKMDPDKPAPDKPASAKPKTKPGPSLRKSGEPGSETERLAQERAASAARVREAAAERAAAREAARDGAAPEAAGTAPEAAAGAKAP